MYKNTFRRAQTLETTLEIEFTKELSKNKSFLFLMLLLCTDYLTLTSKKEETGDLILVGQLVDSSYLDS